MEELQIKIRDIQHYLYCPHRWGLLNIDCAWAENYYVVRANLLHERVHDSSTKYSNKNKTVLSSVWVYNHTAKYNIYGIIDCIEVGKNKDGSDTMCIVEYKPTAPKNTPFNNDDALQVFAQKICVDAVFNTNCQCEIYYANTKKRIHLPFDENYEIFDKQLIEALAEMRKYMCLSEIPSIKKGQNCSGCSLKDVCMPTKSKKLSLRSEINRFMESI